MKKEFLVVMCVMGLVFGAASMANAGALTWTLASDDALIGMGPGLDELLGTADDTTSGEKNNCNFNSGVNCDTTGTPSTGTYSFVKMDLVMDKSCMTGTNAGGTCVDDTDCPGCVPGLCCAECSDVTYSYLNNGGRHLQGLDNGTYLTCQEDGSTFDYTALKIGTTESLPGTGGGCLSLLTPGDDSGDCGVGTFSSLMDVGISISVLGICNFDGGEVPNVTMAGRIYDLGVATPAGACDYSIAEINAIRASLPGTAQYMTVACANQTLPGGLTTGCLSGADFISVMVAYTTGNASDCASACAGGCLFGTAEGVE